MQELQGRSAKVALLVLVLRSARRGSPSALHPFILKRPPLDIAEAVP
jgi:hypothetical protein